MSGWTTPVLLFCLLPLIFAGAANIGERRWRSSSGMLVRKMRTARAANTVLPTPPRRFALGELQGLPDPVSRYFG